MTLVLGMYHWGCWAYQVCSNNDPRLTLTYLTSRSNLRPSAFFIFFQQIIYCKLEDFIPFLEEIKTKYFWSAKNHVPQKIVPDPIAHRGAL